MKDKYNDFHSIAKSCPNLSNGPRSNPRHTEQDNTPRGILSTKTAAFVDKHLFFRHFSTETPAFVDKPDISRQSCRRRVISKSLTDSRLDDSARLPGHASQTNQHSDTQSVAHHATEAPPPAADGRSPLATNFQQPGIVKKAYKLYLCAAKPRRPAERRIQADGQSDNYQIKILWTEKFYL